MSSRPLANFTVLFLFLLGAVKCLDDGTMTAGISTISLNQSERLSCAERVDLTSEYCCYNMKCWGEQGTIYQSFSVKCNTRLNHCATNVDGFPVCVRDDKGGYWGICGKEPGYTCSCVHDSRGVLADKPCLCKVKSSGSRRLGFYVGICVAVLFGLGFIFRLVHYTIRFFVKPGRVAEAPAADV